MASLIATKRVQGTDDWELSFTGRNNTITFGVFNKDRAVEMAREFRSQYKEYRDKGIKKSSIEVTFPNSEKVILESNFPPENYLFGDLNNSKITPLALHIQDSLDNEVIDAVELG